jgi:DNA mismatch repair ATPase MutS
MAIAQAVLEHLIENVRCKTLFITHYPLLAAEIEKQVRSAPIPLLSVVISQVHMQYQYPDVENAHMGYVENCREGASFELLALSSTYLRPVWHD